MSKGSKNQTVTQETKIPSFLQPFVKNQAAVGNRALNNLEGQLSGAGANELVAGFNPLQQMSQQQLIELAGGAGGFLPTAQQEFLRTAQGVDPSSYLDPAAFGALQSTAAGDFLFGGQGFDQAVQAAIRAAQPSILSTFGGAGRGTGGLAQTAIAKNATDAFAGQFGQERQRQLQASGMLGELSNAERARQLQAAGLLPEMGALGANILGGVGAQQQGQAQRELTAPISAQESLLAAAGGGIPLQSLLGMNQSQPGAGGGFNFGNALGAGALGLGAASMTAAPGATGLAAFGGPWGLAGGAGLGLLGGLLS